jgi:hypothetical protein
VHGYQIGTQCPILHAEWDQEHPIGFNDVEQTRIRVGRDHQIETQGPILHAEWDQVYPIAPV